MKIRMNVFVILLSSFVLSRHHPIKEMFGIRCANRAKNGLGYNSNSEPFKPYSV